MIKLPLFHYLVQEFPMRIKCTQWPGILYCSIKKRLIMDELKNKAISEIKKIYDPEIPVNIYELGLIYKRNRW